MIKNKIKLKNNPPSLFLTVELMLITNDLKKAFVMQENIFASKVFFQMIELIFTN